MDLRLDKVITFDRKKDKVALIAPSSACRDLKGKYDVELSQSQLEVAISLFEEHGFSCTYDDKIFVGGSLEYFASSKEERFRQLKDALEDPSIKIISMFRGGYGAGEIVFDCLEVKPSSPKILIGFSDITVLHFLFNQHYKFPSIHGSVTEKNKDMMKNMVSVLSGQQGEFILQAQNNSAYKEADITGEISGGNLTLICNMIGTKLHPSFANKILLLEDINERGYCVHRHLLHMHNANLFKDVKAVMLGDFTESDNMIDASLAHFIENYLEDIPVFKINGIGHGKINYPITLGAPAVINNFMLNVQSPFKVV